METVRFITLGCSKNSVDTEHILAQLPEDRFRIIPEDSDEDAQTTVLNTCGFIGDAKQESIDAILEAVELKKQGRTGKVLVFGCLSQRYSKDMPKLIPEVDGWYGARDISEVVRALGAEPSRSCTTRKRGDSLPYAYLKISEGCDRRCSYCAIPLIRGAHRSVPMEELVREAESLAAEGVRELILIAQDTTWYGLDLYGKRNLKELISRLCEVEGIEWIRIHYSYPADFPEDVLEEMALNPKVCKYLDIPLQHISDGVLAAMRRGVDGKWTRELISKLRTRVPEVVLRTTMIVGHPGEGEAEFSELLDFVREARFGRLGAFSYSEEEGTFGARKLKDDVPEAEKKRRLDALMELQSSISLELNRARVGSVERVLVDDWTGKELVCRSQYESPEVDGEILVRCEDEETVRKLKGNFASVRITGADEYDLTAELI